MGARGADVPSGLLLIDKPSGLTSHDVVARVRRILGTRSVGHAGTLDPMATGVLVIMVGSCTKLSRFLVLDDKLYLATVRLGQATDTLDAEGVSTESAPIPSDLSRELSVLETGDVQIDSGFLIQRAIEQERVRTAQVPPSHSAIKHQGVASYRRARRGESILLPPRDVFVHALQVVGATIDPPELKLIAHVSKGYYVRSLARDLGAALGIPSHLTALRRLRSGPWSVESSVGLEDAESLRRVLVPVVDVARTQLPCARLTSQGSLRAVQGKMLSEEDFEIPPGSSVSAWFGPDERLVAVGDRSRGRPTVLRAFLHGDEMC